MAPHTTKDHTMDTYIVIGWYGGEAIFECYSPDLYLDAFGNYIKCCLDCGKAAIIRISPDLYSFVEYHSGN
jgi:hypothetical protein